MIAVLDRQFGVIEQRLTAAAELAKGMRFGEQVRRFLLAAGDEL